MGIYVCKSPWGLLNAILPPGGLTLAIQESKKKIRKGLEWVCEQTCQSLLHSQEALGRFLQPESQCPSHVESDLKSPNLNLFRVHWRT